MCSRCGCTAVASRSCDATRSICRNDLWHGGAELRPRALVDFGPLAVVRLVAAADVKVVSDTTERTGLSVRAGFEFARPHEAEVGSRRWSLLAEYYNGPSPYGQFHRTEVRLTGIGLHFTL